MNLDINKIVVLGNDEKYLIIDKVIKNDITYYYVAEANEQEFDIKDNYKIITIEENEGQHCLVEVLGEDKLKEVLPLFLENIENNE